jgi:signal peptidase I
MTNLKRNIFYLLILLSLLACEKENPKELSKNYEWLISCVSKIENREVRGNSMVGIFKEGDNVKIKHNYYDCNRVELHDLVVFDYSGNLGDNLYLIKKVFAIPGDNITVVDNFLLVNGRNIYNYNKQPYKVDKVGASYIGMSQKRQMKDNKIPQGYYLVLGTAVSGGWDSRRFGLISHSKLVGKAESNN